MLTNVAVFDIIDRKEFIFFNNQKSSDNCLDIENRVVIRVTDEQAKRVIEKYSKCKNISEFQNLDIKNRDKCLIKFRECGLSIKRISRLTGVSFSIVRKFQ